MRLLAFLCLSCVSAPEIKGPPRTALLDSSIRPGRIYVCRFVEPGTEFQCMTAEAWNELNRPIGKGWEL